MQPECGVIPPEMRRLASWRRKGEDDLVTQEWWNCLVVGSA